MSRPVLFTAITAMLALACFAIGSYWGARHALASDTRIDTLRSELASLRRNDVARATGTSGRGDAVSAALSEEVRSTMVADIKKQLQAEMGLLPLQLLKSRKESFVELYSYDDRGGSSYGTAGYLGGGYFITVKHAVVALDGKPGSSAGFDDTRDGRKISSIKLMYRGRALRARVVDHGDATAEVDPGDWAVLKVQDQVDLPALTVDLSYPYDFADPIFRLGNDYSKGIILSTGYVGQRTGNDLVTCLTDGHPGVSGGGVLNREGALVGIPVGRMQGDYRFSFILPLRAEMFRRVPDVKIAELMAN
ncbi:MAG: trypsin-like peptidase domain-containing protein [Acidobacteria bacterium]|nr:trypsin-like peptidase domain-containing protein [Acidobacteriota bacterium]